MDGVIVPHNGRVVDLPARRGKHVFVALVPRALHDLARVALVLLDGGVGDQPHVVVDVEVEQRPRLATGLGHDQVVEGIVLRVWREEWRAIGVEGVRGHRVRDSRNEQDEGGREEMRGTP